MSGGVEKVALLALAYRELFAPATGYPDDLSLIAKMVAETLDDDLELLLVEAADDPARLRRIAADLAPVEPIRAEALLHAFPADESERAWTRAARRRWREVEQTMEVFASLGLASSRSEVDAIAEQACALAIDSAT